MDTESKPGPGGPPPAPPGTDEDDLDDNSDDATEPRARHCSTGKLTIAQSRIVNAWRRQLTVPDRRRWHTLNHHPPASSSDCIAAAVVDLLDHAEPDHLTLIRSGARIRDQLELERGQAFPLTSAVSFYLPAVYVTRVDELLLGAQQHHADLLRSARSRISAESPTLPDERNIPDRAYKLPVGTLARMSIDRWARRSPTTVVAAAVRHGDHHHLQQHRARRDMGVGDSTR